MLYGVSRGFRGYGVLVTTQKLSLIFRPSCACSLQLVLERLCIAFIGILLLAAVVIAVEIFFLF
jgi:hypothetical protein